MLNVVNKRLATEPYPLIADCAPNVNINMPGMDNVEEKVSYDPDAEVDEYFNRLITPRMFPVTLDDYVASHQPSHQAVDVDNLADAAQDAEAPVVLDDDMEVSQRVIDHGFEHILSIWRAKCQERPLETPARANPRRQTRTTVDTCVCKAKLVKQHDVKAYVEWQCGQRASAQCVVNLRADKVPNPTVHARLNFTWACPTCDP